MTKLWTYDPNCIPSCKGKTEQARRKRGRPRGSRNKSRSGWLTPIVEFRKGKTGVRTAYPVTKGKRVPKDLAYDYPKQFNWLYQWSEWCDRRERWGTRSRRVQSIRVHTVRYMICDKRPVSKILEFIRTGELRNRPLMNFRGLLRYKLLACRLRKDYVWELTGKILDVVFSLELPDWQETVNNAGVWAIAVTDTETEGVQDYVHTFKPHKEMALYQLAGFSPVGEGVGVIAESQAYTFSEVEERFQAVLDGSKMTGFVTRIVGGKRTRVEEMRDRAQEE